MFPLYASQSHGCEAFSLRDTSKADCAMGIDIVTPGSESLEATEVLSLL